MWKPKTNRNTTMESNMKTFKIRNSNMTTEGRESLAHDTFGCFLYKDQFTHRRYKINKLQPHHRTKTTEPNEKRLSESNVRYYMQELNLFKSIRQNRNRNVLSANKKTIKHNQLQPTKKLDINHIKHEIRQQILNMNQEYLREYLYRQQPFNHLFSRLHKASNLGTLDEKKLKQLKNTIRECTQHPLRSESEKRMNNSKQHIQKMRKLKEEKKKIQSQIDTEFEHIWLRLEKDISRKIKKEGEYNWENCKSKKLYK